MTTYNFSANGMNFGDFHGETLRDAMEAFASDAGYSSWDDMTDQAIELSGSGTIEIRERYENGQLGSNIAPDQTKAGVVSAELSKLALTGISLEGSGDKTSLDEAIPVPLAQKLCARLQYRNLEASWATDHDDAELAWVYVRVDA